jgi:PrgI family protein
VPRVYELPTHLQVEDTLLPGLTARQLLRLLVGASLAYGLWDQAAGLPPVLRIALTAGLALVGLLLALLQPGGRPLDGWLLAALLFAVLPRRRVWRCSASESLASRPGSGQSWARLAPRPAWVDPELDDAPGADPGSTAAGAPGRRWRW